MGTSAALPVTQYEKTQLDQSKEFWAVAPKVFSISTTPALHRHLVRPTAHGEANLPLHPAHEQTEFGERAD